MLSISVAPDIADSGRLLAAPEENPRKGPEEGAECLWLPGLQRKLEKKHT
jgi:hypothetical protein